MALRRLLSGGPLAGQRNDGARKAGEVCGLFLVRKSEMPRDWVKGGTMRPVQAVPVPKPEKGKAILAESDERDVDDAPCRWLTQVWS